MRQHTSVPFLGDIGILHCRLIFVLGCSGLPGSIMSEGNEVRYANKTVFEIGPQLSPRTSYRNSRGYRARTQALCSTQIASCIGGLGLNILLLWGVVLA